MSSDNLQATCNNSDRRKKYVRLIGLVHNSLLNALAEESEERGVTQAHIADLLGWNKSFVSRKLNGASNVTLKTIADLAWALGRDITFNLPKRPVSHGANHVVVARSNEAISKLGDEVRTVPAPLIPSDNLQYRPSSVRVTVG